MNIDAGDSLEHLATLLRERRLALHARRGLSLRQLAERLQVTPGYVSHVETAKARSAPSEELLVRWADELGLDPDVVLAVAGKVSGDLRAAIVKRPQIFGELIRELKDLPDQAVLRVVREVRDGNW